MLKASQILKRRRRIRNRPRLPSRRTLRTARAMRTHDRAHSLANLIRRQRIRAPRPTRQIDTRRRRRTRLPLIRVVVAAVRPRTIAHGQCVTCRHGPLDHRWWLYLVYAHYSDKRRAECSICL